MHIDTEALAALAGLEPMPRQPLAINPCPEGYQLKVVGGSLMCVLEGADELDLSQASALRRRRSVMRAIQSIRQPQNIGPGAPQSPGGTP